RTSAPTSVSATSFILVHSERAGTSPARRSILLVIGCDSAGQKNPDVEVRVSRYFVRGLDGYSAMLARWMSLRLASVCFLIFWKSDRSSAGIGSPLRLCSANFGSRATPL